MADSRALTLTNGASTGGIVVAPQTFPEVMMFAEQMSKCSFVPRHLRGKPADCLAVCLQALRWEMDPFSVAQKTYFANEGGPPGYEAQLISAVILSRAPIEGRLNISWSGSGQDLSCTVVGKFRGDPNPKSKTCRIATITVKNSPLWKSDPEQQLAYYTTRAWARLYAPDVIMGIYTPDELRDVTPAETIDAETGELINAGSGKPMSRLDALEDSISDPSDPPSDGAPGPSQTGATPAGSSASPPKPAGAPISDAPGDDASSSSGMAASAGDGVPHQPAEVRPYSTYTRDRDGARQYLADLRRAVERHMDRRSGAVNAFSLREIMVEHRPSLDKLAIAKDGTIAGNASSLIRDVEKAINPPKDQRGTA